jgi:hypothetical protein
LAVSLFVHLFGGALWSLFMRLLHVPTPPETQVVAKIEPIEIERIRPTPTPTPEPTPRPVLRIAAPSHTAVRPKSAPPRERPVIAAATLPPAAEPTARPRPAQIHHPRSQITAMVPVPHGARGAAHVNGALTEAEIAAMEGSFRRTIAQAQQAVAETPAPQAVVGTTKDYNDLLKGSVDDIVGGNGICDPVDEGQTRGPYTYYYLTCSVRYTDGYFERVAFPWPFKFTRGDDPFIHHDGRAHSFPPQPPPEGFVLPRPFALSRAVCTYYREACEAVLKQERAAGTGPGGG